VKLSSGDSLKYDHLIIATGSRPRALTIPGSYSKNIFVLRSPNDANQIQALSDGKNVVIIGTSFIGMEVAAALVGEND
jgi:NADPH-dependent 2,4-dienoyl-CoA reductase/sulfur reductase-like enzyme